MTYVDEEGVPRLVQSWRFCSWPQWYEVELFDGRHTHITAELVADYLPCFKRWTHEIVTSILEDIVARYHFPCSTSRS